MVPHRRPDGAARLDGLRPRAGHPQGAVWAQEREARRRAFLFDLEGSDHFGVVLRRDAADALSMLNQLAPTLQTAFLMA